MKLVRSNASPLFGRVIGAPSEEIRLEFPNFTLVRLSRPESRAAIRRIAESAERNIDLPVPGEDAARTAISIAKNPLARRAAKKVIKITAGATGGYLIGRKWGGRAGAATGALAGLLFSDLTIRNRVQLSVKHAKQILHT